MNDLANGCVFHFSPKNYNHPGFVKVSNLFAIDLKDGKIGANANNPVEASKIEVVYAGFNRRDLLTDDIFINNTLM